jgi:energy-coupling factor transporter ATP-binding protein EcfA2
MTVASSTGTHPAIRVSGLTYRYPDGKDALRGVELIVPSGQSVALVGPNGAGKSTLLLHLNGLLPGKPRGALSHAHGAGLDGRDRRSRGEAQVWIDGIEVNERSAREVRRRVGLVFQDPDDQLFCDTVLSDVAFGPLNQGKSAADARAIALECLARVELAPLADRPPHHLSFGERKRACLAGVLACEPSVLVLDEPSANLDPRARRRFIQLILGLSCTKLIATHDLELVLEVCPRTVVLDDGQVAADGPSRAILGDQALMDAHGLELPLSLRYVPGGQSPHESSEPRF